MKTKNIVLNLVMFINLSACNTTDITTGVVNIPSEVNNKTDQTSIVTPSNKPTAETNTNETKELLSLKETELTLVVGQTFNFLDKVTLADMTKISSIKFNSSDNNILSIDNTGKVSALKEGKIILKVELIDQPAKFKECKIIVKPQEIEKDLVTPTSIKINDLNSELSLNTQDKFNFTATIKYSDNKTDNKVLWKSSDESIASINNDGTLLALKKGLITITASSALKTDLKTSISVNITEKVVSNSNSTSTTTTSSNTNSSSSSSILGAPFIALSELKNELLVFNSQSLSANAIFTFNGDSSNLKKITLPFTKVEQVSLSNSENNLLFVGDNIVRTVNIDGNRVVHIRDGLLANPVFSFDGLRILYTTLEGVNKNIVSSAFHGSNSNKITNNGVSREASFFPNGNLVFVEQDVNIKKMDINGNNISTIYKSTKTVYFPMVSPDGNKIAFIQKDDDFTFNIYTINSDGTNLTNVTNNVLGTNVKIEKIIKWSKDSKKVFYTSNKSDDGIYVSNVDASAYLRLPITFSLATSCCSAPTGKMIYISDKEGSDKTYLKTFETDSEIKIADIGIKSGNIFYNRNSFLVAGTDGIYWGLDKSSTLTKVANTTSESNYPEWTPDGRVVYSNDGNIAFLSNIEGTSVTPIPLGNLKNGNFEFAPDGSKIVYTSVKVGETVQNIYTMNNDTSNKKQLTILGNNSAPVWSPDGKKIAFDSDRTGKKEVFIMNIDGTEQTALTTIGGYEPKWSPDGKKIAFTSEKDGKKAIYLMNPDGSNIEKLLGDTTKNYYLKNWK